MNSGEETLVSLHWKMSRSRPGDTAIAFRRDGAWHRVSWRDYLADSLACANGLVEVGVRPGDRVALLSENRYEWPVADMGIQAAAAVSVPIHATLPAEQIAIALRDSGARWVFCSGADQLAKVSQIESSLAELMGATLFDPAGGRDVPALGDWIARFRDRPSAELELRRAALGPDSLATIVYTSGSTGKPRGVMLTHRNILATAHALDEVFPSEPGAAVLAWLPFSHIVARTVDHFMGLLNGAAAWIAESPETVIRDLREVQPTHLSGVPRFYEKVLAAADAGGTAARAGRLRAIFGPRLKWVTSGSAPLPRQVAEAFEQAGLPIVQGYGLTETSGVLTCNRPGSNKIGTVGQPLPGLEVAIASDGEILARGPNVTSGYWNDPAATRDAIRDGWFYTGDLGEQDDDGFVTVRGRKKELIVLSTGKKVVPSEVEGTIATDPCVEQVVIFGEGRSSVAALIVPGAEFSDRVARTTPGDGTGAEEVVHDFAVRIARAQQALPPEARIRRFLVLRRGFSIEEGTLSVTMKPRRDLIFAKYGEPLDRLFALARDDGENPIGLLEGTGGV